jgi:hypothetical protein
MVPVSVAGPAAYGISTVLPRPIGTEVPPSVLRWPWPAVTTSTP